MTKDPVIIWYNIQIEQIKQQILNCNQYPPTTYSRNKINRLRIELTDLEIQKKMYRLSRLHFR